MYYSIPFNSTIRPTVIDRSLANGTNTIKSRRLVTIVRTYGPLSGRTLPLEGAYT